MFCNKCGNRNPLNSHFCRHCGARLDLPGAATQVAEEMYQVSSEEMQPVYDDAKVQRLLERAFNLNEQSDPVGAILTCREALAENPTSVSAHSFLGLLYERQGEKEKALSQYEIVLQLNPDSTTDRENLNRLRSEMRRPTRAAVAAIPSTPLLATILDEKWVRSPYIRALPVVAAAMTSLLLMLIINLAVSPPAGSGARTGQGAIERSVASYVQKGRDAFARGDLDNAEKDFRAALLLSPTDSDVQYWLSRVNSQRTPGGVSGTANLAQNPNPTPPAAQPPAPQPASSNPTQPSVPSGPSANGSATVNSRPVVTASNPNPRASSSVIPPLPSSWPSSWVATRRTRDESSNGAGSAGRDSTPFSPAENVGSPLPSDTRSSSSPHLSYRVTQAPASGDANKSGNAAPAKAAPESVSRKTDSGNEGTAFYYQNQGFQMQRQRRYVEARTSFQKALQAYRQQRETGAHAREADEGIKTCEIALRLCNIYLGS